MFSNCILREEDGYYCNKSKTDKECIGCPYYYEGGFFSILVGGLFLIFLLVIICLVSLIFLPISLVIDLIRKLGK